MFGGSKILIIKSKVKCIFGCQCCLSTNILLVTASIIILMMLAVASKILLS